MTAGYLIEYLELVHHPEGGWFRESYRSQEQVQTDALPQRFGGERSFGTAIYFLLESGDISALHRIKSDEIWHFYAGVPLLIHLIFPDGGYQMVQLGADLTAGQQFQAVVPAGCWFGAELSGEGFALVGCTVAPGFDFTDFELARRTELQDVYPEHATLITRLTRT
jgi:uncharacterized protein